MAEVERHMQTRVVSKEKAKTRRPAVSEYRRRLDEKPRTVRETSTSFRFAWFPEDQCAANSHRTQVLGDGVSAVWCDRRMPD